MSKNRRKQFIPDLALVLVTVIWGTTFTIIKEALVEISPFLFISLRFGLATCILGILLIRKLNNFTAADVKYGIIAGLFLFWGFAFQTVGLQYTTASKSGFITGLNVIMTPFPSALLLKRRLKISTILAALIALVGLWLLTNPQNSSYNIGDAYTLICAASFAGHIVCLEYYTRRVDYRKLAFIQIATVAILSFTTTGIREGFGIPPFNKGVIFAVAMTGILATALCFFIQNWAQSKTTATRAALIFTLEPVFAAVIAYFVLNETLGVSGLLGGVLILIGIVLSEIT